MADNKIITDDILKKATENILQLMTDNSYKFVPYTQEEIQEVFDLDEVTAQSLSKVINDEFIAKNKVYSNEYTNTLLEKVKAECNQYTVEQIANSGNLKRKIVTATSDVTDESILYLILTDSTNNIYTQYMLIDGTATPLGTTQVDLSDYVLITDLDSKLDLKANKNEVIPQSNVVADLTTVSSDTVLSTQGSKDELNKKVDKTSIATSISSTSTDDTVPSAKAVYDNAIKDKLGNLTLDYTYKDSDSMNITLGHFGAYKFSSPTKGIPSYNVGDWVLINIPWGVNNNVTSMRYANQLLFSPRFEGFWHRTVWNYDSSAYTYAEGDYSVFRKWKRVCSISVNDITPTSITNFDSSIFSGAVNYEVKNGICYAVISNFSSTSTGASMDLCNFITPKMLQTTPIISDTTGEVIGLVYITATKLKVHIYKSGMIGYASFSYPVAES